MHLLVTMVKVVLSFLLLTTTLLPITSHPLPITNQGHQIYIVHVLKPNDTDYISDEHRIRHHLSFLPINMLDTGEPRLIYSYSQAISGFAARLTPDEVEEIRHKNGVLLVVPDHKIVPQTTYTPAFLGLHPSSDLWKDSNFGEGIIIAILDSGIDPNHLSFAGNGIPPPPIKWRGKCELPAWMCNNKLIGAVGLRDGKIQLPFDRTGHGTHVASTAAGNYIGANVLGQAPGFALGIAPKAHVAMYQVFDEGSGVLSDVLARTDDAINDGVDIINMSFGFEKLKMYENSLVIAAFAAMRRGIFISAAAGNYGPATVTVCNDAPWMLTVAAGTTDRRIKVVMTLGNGESLHGESANQPNGAEILFKPIMSLVNCLKAMLVQTNISNKIVLCSSSTIELSGEAIKNVGAAALVVLNDESNGISTFANFYVLPSVYLNYPDSFAVHSYASSARNPLGSLYFRGTLFGASMSPSVASFSSRGPSDYNGGILKPDIMGPGVNVIAAWPHGVGPIPEGYTPLNQKFSFMSGTSVAAPHLTGVAAIIKKIHPDWSVAAIKSAMMTTSDSRYPNNSPIIDQYPSNGPHATYFAMGSGQVNPTKAINPGLIYDIDAEHYIRYMCGMGYDDQQMMTVVQSTINCATLERIAPEDLNYPSISLKLAAGTMKRVTRTLTNVGTPECKYVLKYRAPMNLEMKVTPEELSFSMVGENDAFTIEFKSKVRAKPTEKEVVEGEIMWVNGEIVVRSPIIVTIF